MSGADIAAEIAAALAEAGEAVGDGPLEAKLLRPGKPTGPVHKPVYPEPTSFDCLALEEETEQYLRAGTLVEGTERVFMVSGLTVEPSTKDRLSVDGKVLKILKFMPFRPGGVSLYWTLMVSS